MIGELYAGREHTKHVLIYRCQRCGLLKCFECAVHDIETTSDAVEGTEATADRFVPIHKTCILCICFKEITA